MLLSSESYRLDSIQLSKNFGRRRWRDRDRLGPARIRDAWPREALHRATERTDPLLPGGADRVRTDDFRLAKAALSQLSYSP